MDELDEHLDNLVRGWCWHGFGLNERVSLPEALVLRDWMSTMKRRGR